jgi:hypothetical protein
MNKFDIRNFHFWYGPVNFGVDEGLQGSWLQLSKILHNFKSGNFSQREELFDLCCQDREAKFSVVAIQLFFLVARKIDLSILEKYCESATDTQLKSFALFSLKSMLGVPLARWFTSIINRISESDLTVNMGDHLESFLPKSIREQFGFDVPISRIIEAIENTIPHNMPYIFNGAPLFLGDIAISMQHRMQVAISLDPPGILGDGTGPTLISAASGLECPVSYATVMTPDKVKAVLDYVKEVSAMGKAMGGWKRGSKYFYGHEIV